MTDMRFRFRPTTHRTAPSKTNKQSNSLGGMAVMRLPRRSIFSTLRISPMSSGSCVPRSIGVRGRDEVEGGK
eukprot:1551053-Rhodomonas_salina.2